MNGQVWPAFIPTLSGVTLAANGVTGTRAWTGSQSAATSAVTILVRLPGGREAWSFSAKMTLPVSMSTDNSARAGGGRVVVVDGGGVAPAGPATLKDPREVTRAQARPAATRTQAPRAINGA